MNTLFRTSALIIVLWACAVPTTQAQQVFATPELAAQAFLGAVENRDKTALSKILGTNWKEYVPTENIGDEDVTAFVAAAKEAHRILHEGQGRAHLEVGTHGWTLPIPLRSLKKGWQFDLKHAREEIRTRRVGRNELAAIQAVRAYVDAQQEYAEADRNGDGINEYAQRLVSTPGQRDGLYWEAADGEPASPLGPLFGDDRPGHEYHGYHFRILTAQGPHAEGGARSYLIGPRLTGGFALVAWPAVYDDSGVKTFIVSHDGQIYEKDLGSRTDSLARRMTQFDPDTTWTKVAINEP